ncbi:MAG: SH3 domain-containing protein [Anaerolineales bacterium]|nr:SH3 domain-containing protein [Anaerolineales bacterium]
MLRRSFVFIFSIVIISCGFLSPSTEQNNQDIQLEPTKGPFTGSEAPEAAANQDLFLTNDDLNLVPPDDIIQEIGFFGGLGGAGSVCDYNNYQSPTFTYLADRPYEWMQNVSVTICGLTVGEEAQVVVNLPNGATVRDTAIVRQTESENMGELSYDYMPLVYDPVGEYTITFTGNAWVLEYPFMVIEPPDARLYLHESQLLLINFFPNEIVRLFVYSTSNSNNSKLVGWKKFQVNDDGDLILNLENNDSYVVIGEFSGQVSVNIESGDVYCQNTRNPVGVLPNGYAQVTIDDLPTFSFDANQHVWVKGGYSGLKEGEIVQIVSNAACANETFLWEVRCVNNNCKYAIVPESGSDGYYLRPLEELPPTSTANLSIIPTCLGTQPTRLQIGMNAEVTRSGMAPQLSLRAQPSLSAEKVHVIAAGRKITILQGPVCADSSYWWYIRSEQGFEGWAREGDNEDYWIDPLP